MAESDNYVYYTTEEEFDLAFKRLNALCEIYEQWQRVRANKRHEDIFGVPIGRGEVYFKKDMGQAFDAVAKVSRRSMEKLLYLVVKERSILAELGDEMLEEDKKRLRQKRDRLETRGEE